MKVEKKLGFLAAYFLVAFIIFGLFSYISFSMVKVKGQIYNDIVAGKDLIADILPPPQYIIESYLVVLQLVNETDTVKINALLQRSDELRNEFNVRHAYWDKNLESSDLKNSMVIDLYQPAQEFFNIRDAQFIPAVKSGDRAKAAELANGILKQKYEEHKLKVNEVVTLANERNADNEQKARNIVRLINIVLILLSLLIIVFSLYMWNMIKQSLKPLDQVTLLLKDISEGEGDLTRHINVSTNDEVGEFAGYFNRFIDKIREIARNIYQTTVELNHSASQINAVAAEMAASSENTNHHLKKTGMTVNSINASLGGLADSIGNTGGNINMVASAVEEMSGTTRSLASASEQTSVSVTHVSDLAANISRSINTLSDSSRDVSALVSNVATAVKEINISLSEINHNCERSIHITSDDSQKATIPI
jgi:methyl-accepting chemotaxis protein